MEDQLLSPIDFENQDELLIHEWRTDQLHRLGIPRLLAQIFAADVDWHEVAALVGHGCPPLLAVEIAR